MRDKWKRFIAVSLILMLCLNMPENGVIAYAAEQTKDISGEIEVILNRNEVDMQSYIEAFERKYPEVDVKYTCYNDFETSIKVRMEEGDYGDVLYIPSFVNGEQTKDYFEPLGDFDALNEKYNYLVQGRYFDNVVYGIPSSVYLIGVIYNKEVFDKAGITSLPKTIDEFEYAMYLIDENTNAVPMYTGYKDPWVLAYWELFPYIEMTGDASYKYSGLLNDINPFREGTVHNKTMKLLYNMVERGYTEVNGESISWWDSVIKLNSGEIGCVMMGTWALYDYKNVGPLGENIGFMPFPNNVDGKQYVTATANYSYAVAKNSDNKEAAKAFLDFLLDESGFAFNHDMLSVLKTDPYPECYGDMTDTFIQSVSYPSVAEAYTLYDSLTGNLKLYYQDEYVRIVEAAAGIVDESFEDIMNDWNTRWESGRNGIILPDITGDELDNTESTVIVIENTQIEFSENEKEYIKQNSLLTVGYHKNLAPLSFEEDGEFVGIARDICKNISKKSGLSMKYRGYDSTSELIAALENGEIDLIAGIEKTGDNTGIKYSKDYLEYMDVVVRHNTVDGSSLKKFSGASGEKYEYFAESEQFIDSATIDKSIDNVERLIADFTITNYYSANYYIRKNNYDDVTAIPYANNQTYHIAFAEDTNPVLIAICNKCIYSLPDGEMEIALMEYMDSVVLEVTIGTFIRANPLTSILIITVAFLMLFLVFYERYRAKNKQALAAKKYQLLASLADECIFEYNYKKEKFKFDSKFVSLLGFESSIERNAYNGENVLVNQFLKQIASALDEAKDTQFTMVLNNDNDERQWYRVVTSVVLNQKKQPVHMIGKLMNIQKEMEEVANYQNKAHRDSLTKLYNREGLSAHLPKDANGVMLAVMDMDDFKMVNDTLGHDGGDYALMYFADKLEEHMGTQSLVARYGGDEFIAMLTGVSENEAKERLEELVKSMNVSLRFAGNSRKVSISVGAVYSDNMDSFEDMFHEADKVLYKAKEEGKNNYKLEVR